jgi:hypothetical protein
MYDTNLIVLILSMGISKYRFQNNPCPRHDVSLITLHQRSIHQRRFIYSVFLKVYLGGKPLSLHQNTLGVFNSVVFDKLLSIILTLN